MIRQDQNGNYIFKCLRCGDCCKNLIPSHGMAGLYLFPDEVRLFPSHHIKPCLGVGITPHDPDFHILTYQFNESVCPHLQNNDCEIYTRRPLACRSYPVSADYGRGEYTYKLSPDCRFGIELKQVAFESMSFRKSSEHKNAKMITDRLIDFYELRDKRYKQWAYILSKEIWQLFSYMQEEKKAWLRRQTSPI